MQLVNPLHFSNLRGDIYRELTSGALHALILAAVALGLGSAASYIPRVVLAGILIMAGTVITLTVLLVTVFIDLITSVSIGMVMASNVFLKRQSDQQLANITMTTDPGGKGRYTAISSERTTKLLGRQGDAPNGGQI